MTRQELRADMRLISVWLEGRQFEFKLPLKLKRGVYEITETGEVRRVRGWGFRFTRCVGRGKLISEKSNAGS